MNKIKVTIGTVIEGTFRNADIIPAFLCELDCLGAKLPDMDSSPIYSLIDTSFRWIDEDSAATGEYLESEEAMWDIESLFEALDEIAPEYCSFGAHPGNDSDYGFWPDLEAIEDDIRYGYLENSPSRGFFGTWADVNDHGNVTLWSRLPDGSDLEIWSCV